ncbi:hypothetical protein ACQX0B_11030 [Corynebacterium diphtheriae]|uniref:hypothetical protein n=1 Tax=Corynebacterium diphtheriae TaxID=1717 RepID=UPI0013CAB0FD|nr:hypothetical protein [Corynebacterium diphtheriae]CAB0667031.1 hypothetical protein CIP107562_02116 [Corynebacterium diphtheriae]
MSPEISKKPLIPKNTKSSRLKPKSCSKKKQTKTKDQETRVNAAEPARQKEYDKLTEQAKHETKEEARRQTEFKKEREKQKQKTKHASNAKSPAPQPQPEPAPAPAPQAQAPVVPQESGSSVGDFIAGILAIVTGALTPMSIGTTANAFLKDNGLPHF